MEVGNEIIQELVLGYLIVPENTKVGALIKAFFVMPFLKPENFDASLYEKLKQQLDKALNYQGPKIVRRYGKIKKEELEAIRKDLGKLENIVKGPGELESIRLDLETYLNQKGGMCLYDLYKAAQDINPQDISSVDLAAIQKEMRKKQEHQSNWSKPVIKVESVIEKNGQYIARFTFLLQSRGGWCSYEMEEASQDYLFGELTISSQLIKYLRQQVVNAESYNSYDSKAIYESYFENVHEKFKQNIPNDLAVKSISNPKLRMMEYFLKNYFYFFQYTKKKSRSGTDRYQDITFKYDYNVNFTYKNNRLFIDFKPKMRLAEGDMRNPDYTFLVPIKTDLSLIPSMSFEDVEDLSIYSYERIGDIFIYINEVLPTVWGAKEGGMTEEDAEECFQDKQGIFPYLSPKKPGESNSWWQRVHLVVNRTGTPEGIRHHKICYNPKNGLFTTLDGKSWGLTWRTLDDVLSDFESEKLPVIKPEESSFLTDDELLPNIWGAQEGGMTLEKAQEFFKDSQGIFPRLASQKSGENKPWWQRIRLVVNQTGSKDGIIHYLISYIPAKGFTLPLGQKIHRSWTLDGLLNKIEQERVFPELSVIKSVVDLMEIEHGTNQSNKSSNTFT